MEGFSAEAGVRRDIKKIFEEVRNEENKKVLRCPKATRIPIFSPSSLINGEVVESKYQKMMKRLEKHDY